jgi:leucyl aminopeptidase
MSGIEILVDNTDAEGRVVMADMIWSAINHRRCTKVIEMSTLTGACLVALGKKTAGLFANDDALAAVLEASSKKTGESIWRLPVTDDHKKQIESKFGDVVNTGGKFAGASTAAAFLFKFAGTTPFAHLDIAGPVWGEEATGFGVELVTDAIESLAHAA